MSVSGPLRLVRVTLRAQAALVIVGARNWWQRGHEPRRLPSGLQGLGGEILRAIEEKTLTEEELDACVDGLLDAVLTLSENAEGKKRTFPETAHHDLARRAAEESAVLLKNTDEILPLKAGCKVAVIGDFAVEPRYQGAGSSMVNPTYLETIEKVIGNYDLQVVGINRGYKRTGEADEAMKKGGAGSGGSGGYCSVLFRIG